MSRLQANNTDAPTGVVLEAAAQFVDAGEPNSPKAFEAVAYTGGPMRPMIEGVVAKYPIVIDLAGMEPISKSRPVLYRHREDEVLGHVTAAEVRGNELHVRGLFSAANSRTDEVVMSAKRGFPWQVSVGMAFGDAVFIQKGKTAIVNGKPVDGPVYIARRSVLREVSFVSLGADDATSANIAANAAESESAMTFEEWLKARGFDRDGLSDTQLAALQATHAEGGSNPAFSDQSIEAGAESTATDAVASQPESSDETQDPVATLRANAIDEASRIEGILKAAPGDENAALRTKAIKEGWTPMQAENQVLKARLNRASDTTRVQSVPASTPQILEAAICQSLNLPGHEQEFDDKTLQAAHSEFHGRMGLQDLLLRAAYASGEYQGGVGPASIRGNLPNILRAAFSNADIGGILSNIASKQLLRGYTAVENVWRQISSIVPTNDYKSFSTYRLTAGGAFAKLAPDGTIPRGTLTETAYPNKVEPYGEMISVTKTMIVNDDLGAIQQIPQQLGRNAGTGMNDVFWATFKANTGLFKVANANLLTGAGSALDEEALTAAVKKYAEMKDSNGNPVAYRADRLLVPPALETVAKKLFTSTELGDSAAVNGSANIHAGMYQPLVSAYLSAAFGGSDTAWYLLTNPLNAAAIEVGLLNGRDTPVVEQAEANFDTLGIQMRVTFDFGVALQEHTAGIKNAGT